jgi:hypothetical protein
MQRDATQEIQKLKLTRNRRSVTPNTLTWNKTHRATDNSWGHTQVRIKIFFLMAQHPLVGQGLLIIEVSRSHSDTSHSVGLLWTSDQPNAETSTSQHSQEADIHAVGGIQTCNPSNRPAADPRLRRRSHWANKDYTLHQFSCTARITQWC